MQPTISSLLNYCFANHPDLVSLINFTGLVRRAKVKQRQVDVQGTTVVAKYGQVIAEVPAAVAQSLQRPHDERDLLLLIHIPRELADEAYERLTSPIMSPNGHGGGNILITP